MLSARKYYLETKDAAGAAAKMPKWRSIEKSLLHGLEKHAAKSNLLGALNFVLVYITCMQSSPQTDTFSIKGGRGFHHIQ